MTDPIVKQSLLELVSVIRQLTAIVERTDRRVYCLEERLDDQQNCTTPRTL